MATWRRALAFAACLTIGAPAGTLGDVVFTSYTPLSSNPEMARRLLTPLTAASIPKLLARSNSALSVQPINLSEEKFTVYVPSQAPPNGYALLVFVPPWQDARLPEGWDSVLDKYGMIFVSASRSGNDASVLGRREPLAMLAEQNIVQRYHIDAAHIFIGGFSGGSRFAMRLALGYPDVFSGALLDAGSDPIGNATIPLPPRDLFERFRSSTRLVYLTGEHDVPRLEMAAVSKRSMEEWCVFHVDTELTEAFHAIASPAALSQALATLFAPVEADPERLAACSSGIESKLSAEIQGVEALIAQGRRDAALAALKQIDQRYGGLAAPRSLELAQQISQMPK